MKLYYSPGVCSLSPHIVLREVGLDFDLVKIDFKNKGDFLNINPKGLVPVLQLKDGKTLTEGVAIVQYIADQNPQSKLMPAHGTWERSKAQEWLNYIATEVHKSHFPLFHPETGDAAKNVYTEKLHAAYDYIEKNLTGKMYLLGEQFTVADAYLFTILGWASHVKIDLSKWPNVVQYRDRVASRPKIQEALKAEGLIKG